MKKAKVIDEFTNQEVCSINIEDLPKKDDCITLIENNDQASYFKVEKIIRANEEIRVVIAPMMKEWALGFQKMYEREIHFFFADAEYTSFQNEDVG